MKIRYKITFLLLTLAWLPYAFLAAWGLNESAVIRIIIALVGFITWFLGCLSFSGLSSSQTYWNTIGELNQKIKKAEDAWDLYKKAEEKLINAAFKLKNNDKTV